LSLREHQLHAKQQALVARSALLRQTIVDDVQMLAPTVHTVDQAAEFVHRSKRYIPWVAGAALAVLMWKKPRGFTATGRKLLTAWQYAAPLHPWLLSMLTRTARSATDQEASDVD